MANNPFIFNAALSGATGGIHERWITNTDANSYLAVRNTIDAFASVVDAMIPTDPTIGPGDGDLMQSICNSVLAQRYLIASDDVSSVAQAIVALWQALRARLLPSQINTDDIINDSDIPGETLTDALDALADAVPAGAVPTAPEGSPGSPENPGYVSRRVYANAASPAIGLMYAGVIIQAAVTFTTADQLPPGDNFIVDVFASGGSAASGRAVNAVTTDVPGGAGGAGAAHHRCQYSRAELIAALPIVMTIPLGPVGGAAVTDSTGDYPVNNPGIGGAQCSFGTLLTAFGGGGGGSSTGVPISTQACGGAGGGIHSTGAGSTTTASPPAGGGPLGAANTENSGWGGAGGPSGNGQAGNKSVWGGASGGNCRIAVTSGQGGIGGDTTYGCAGGAGGSCRNPVNATPANGASGGVSNFPLNTTRAVGGTGVHGAGVQTASDGAPGATGTYPHGGNGGAAGGDAVATGAGGTAIGGAGGKGGFPGGGGGGGGPAARNASGGSSTSGRGGDAGDACIIITGF